MALVAYDNSDSSDYEEDEPASVPTLKTEATSSEPVSTESGPSTALFNLLPQPSNKKPQVHEEDDEFLHKKETVTEVPKPKAKITIPSLSDFKDVESGANTKPRALSIKKSGLLSILPEPKSSVIATKTAKSLIPHVLTQKPKPVERKLPTPAKLPKVAPIAASTLTVDYSDDSDEDEHQNDFFSFNKPTSPVEDIPLNPEQEKELQARVPVHSQKLPQNVQSYMDNGHSSVEGDEEYSEETSVATTSDAGANDIVLDEEAIRQLCGSRGKRKREDIQIVDVNQQEVLAGAREMMMRGLMDDTTTRVSVKKTGHEPTYQQRKKHQITYLAHQAKANEAELQNQWANNRMSRKQTQNKYGF